MKGRFRKRNVISTIAKSSIGKRITSVALAATILVTGVPFTPFEGLIDFSTMTASGAFDDITANWYDAVYKTADIRSMTDFEKYSQAYYSHADVHYQDTITFNITSNNVELNDFYSIGTKEKPFEGTIILNLGSDNVFWIKKAFFDYVSDKAQIYAKVNGVLQPTYLRIARIGDNNLGEPIFAKHITSSGNTGTPVNWQVEVCTYNMMVGNDTIPTNYNNAGIIGEMEADTNILLDVKDNNGSGTATSIYANTVTGDVGYICGKMGMNANLTVNSISGTNVGYGIKATAGNAGGIVGYMQDGAVLALRTAMLNPAPTITASADTFYAGGLVGKNEGGTVVYQTLKTDAETGDAVLDENNNPIYETAKPYTVGGTVSGKAGAGGLFGYYRPVYTEATVNNETVYTYTYDISDYTVNTVVNGNGSVGGLFGVFDNKHCVNIDTTGDEPVLTFGDGNVIFTSTTEDKTVSATHNSGDIHNFGGFIGYYRSNSMSSTMKFDNVKSTMTRSGGKFTYSYGGAIGRIANTSYVLFDGFELTQATSPTGESGSVFGGLVGDAANSFIDTNETSGRSVKISSGSFNGGGLVGKFEDGVLRLRGATDISGTTCAGGGQIVGSRDDTLAFAESGWALTRKDTPEEYDDIGSWGEVIRFSSDLDQEDVLTVDSDNYITIEAPVTSIGSEEAFAIDAICFSIKVGSTNVAAEGETASYDGNPWLKYATGATLNHTNIVNTALELDADIDLRNIGITGLTRDSGTDKVTYSGTFDGNGHTITLAIGDTSTGFNGNIYRHDKNGLFGILGREITSGEGESATTSIEGGTIESLKLAGTVNVKAHSDMCVGAAAAQATGNLTATDVNVTTVFTHSGASKIIMGRLIGEADSNIGTIAITNPTTATYGDFSGNIQDAIANSEHSGNSNASSCFGGVIGKISQSKTDKNYAWEISNVKLGGKVENTASKLTQRIGGLIAYISSTDTNKQTNANRRTLTLSGITANGVTIEGSAAKDSANQMASSGGLFGYAWYDTDVNVNGVTVGATSASTVKLTGAADLGGMIYNATGKWTIPSGGLTLTNITVDASSATSFGMIINKGWYHPSSTDDDFEHSTFLTSNKSSAIYLLFTATDSYAITTATLTNLNANIVYDELVAYSAYYDEAGGTTKTATDSAGDPYILKNGNGIVSIKSSALTMSGSGASNTYVAKTARGAYMNPWTRYYYDLNTVTNKTASSLTTPQQKLMSWGLKQYAHKSQKSEFADAFGGTFTDAKTETSDTGYYKMAGYSWYPVDLESSVRVQGVFEFANSEFNTCESANGGTYSSSKSSLTKTHHYMMQEGLFRDVTGVTLSLGNTTWKGTINRLTDSYKTYENGTGVLVFGTFAGSKKATAKFDSSSGNIVLDGIRVANLGNNTYAPLLINKIGDYTNLKVYHVSVKNTAEATEQTPNPAPTSKYKTITGAENAATSLIGTAGLSELASNINFTFSDIKLDSRINHSNDNAALNTELDAVYPTQHSIFTKATLLNQFTYASDSDATYDYAITADWTASGHVGNVTYGSELSDSTGHNQWIGVEHWYSGQTHDGNGYLTSPLSGSLIGGATSAYNFAKTIFRPYVNIADTRVNTSTTIINHQIRVNHTSATLSGCGTYNDPYLITGTDFDTISNILSGTGGGTINLPILKHDVSGALTEWEDGDTLADTKWDTYGDKAYRWNQETGKFSTFTEANNITTFNNDGYPLNEVRTYLAGAYYKLNENITLSANFKGLGGTGDEFAVFRGVIIGGGEGKNTITNQTNFPLIVSSYGSVVKNLNIVVDNTNILKTSNTALTEYTESQSNEAYGAVIGQIFGGDNIIDNVKVQFNETTVDPNTNEKTVTVKGKVTVGGTYPYLVPVGGYVGVVVNGALIFRGMEEYRSLDADMNISGLGTGNVTDGTDPDLLTDEKTETYTDNGVEMTRTVKVPDTKYLYVNPIVGRVLNGYVLTETTTYRPFETGTRIYPDGSSKSVGGAVTMRNGTKNCSIPDINTGDTGKLSVSKYTAKTGSYFTTDVTIEDAQALYLFGALIQSKVTQSAPSATSIQLANNDSYGVPVSTTNHYKTTHIGTYESIGANSIGAEPSNATHPYYNAKQDGHTTDSVPYIIGKYTNTYTSGTDNYYGIFAVTNSNTICNIQLGTDNTPATSNSAPFYLPDGFKGLGSYLTNDNYVSLFEFDGQGYNVSLGMSLQYYKGNVEIKTAIAHYNTGYTTIDNYCPPYNASEKPDYAGFGFFNFLRQNRDGTGFSNANTNSQFQIHDLILSGNVFAEVYTTSGNNLGYDYADNSETKSENYRNKDLGIVSVGGLAGVAGNGQNDTISIKGVKLDNLSVFSPKTAGGMIGHLCNQTGEKYKYLYNCSAENLVVSAGQEAGGLVGVIEGKNCIIDGKVELSDNSVVNLSSVNIISTKTGGDINSQASNGYTGAFKNRSYYAGGLVARSEVAITIQNMNVGSYNPNYSGFIGNSDRSEDTLNEESVNNTSYVGKFDYIASGSTKTYIYYSPDKPWSIVGGILGATSYTGNDPTIRNCNVYNLSMYGGFSGGITGRPEGAANIFNCNVSSTQTTAEMEAAESTTGKSKYKITGWYGVGGLTGEPRNTNTIDGCTVSNYVIRCYSEDNSGNCAHAGGFVGRSQGGAPYVRNSSVVNCYIEGRKSSSLDKNEGIGGIVGVNGNGINGYNVLIKDIKLLYNTTAKMDTSSDAPFPYVEIPTKGLYNGYVGGYCDNAIKIVGFSLQITDPTNDTIKSPWGKAPTGTNLTSSFFINADYSCACDDEATRGLTFSNIGLATASPMNNIKDATTNSPITNNKPYVTSSPKLLIDSEHYLTGDGIVGSGYDTSMAKQIIDDAIGTKPTGYYQDIKLSFPSVLKDTDYATTKFALDDKPSGDVLEIMQEKFPELYQNNGEPTFGEIYEYELQSKLTTFKTEITGSSLPASYDFPVLVLDDTSMYATTELLDNYIRVLTNTDYDFAASNNNFVVRFGKCTVQTSGTNTGKFGVSWSTSDSNNPSNLKITKLTTQGSETRYFNIASSYDNEVTAGQFTLVDVEFKIPANVSYPAGVNTSGNTYNASTYGTSEYIAYHLYIPVLVKKMLKFDFSCSTLSGTTYRVPPYEDVRGNVLIENLETPVTLQFTWEYRRTLEDWVKQIQNSENLLQAFTNRKLTVNEHNRGAHNISGYGFPEADMVLIDANNYNKSYYATKSMAYSSGTLLLSAFTTNGQATGGTAFTPLNFINFFDITVSQIEPASNATNVVKCQKLSNSTGATIQVGNDFYKPWETGKTAYYLTFAFKEGMYNSYGEGDDAYSYLKEDYYISFYTKKADLPANQEDTSIYHLVFTSPTNLGNIMPNDKNTNGTCDLFLGAIYSNTMRISGQNQAEQELTTASSTIGATFEADIALTDTSKDIVGGFLGNSSVSIYQSFLINFDITRLGTNALEYDSGIKSEPNVNISSYIIDTDNASGHRLDATTIVKNDEECKISVDNGTLSSNFIELRNKQNLRLYLKDAEEGITIKAVFTLNYSGKDEEDTKQKIVSQFPLRDATVTLPPNVSLSDIGAILLGSSNISPSYTATAYSKTVDDDSGSTKYYTGLKTGGALTYNSDDNSNMYGTYAQLGINAWNSSDTEFPMKTLVTYNTKNINKAETADKMELTITMYRKDHYDTDGQELPISEYIDTDTLKVYKKKQNGQNVYVDNPDDPDENDAKLTSYLYTISNPKSALNYDDETYSIPIDYSIFTGANTGFESDTDETKYYSNYMVKVQIKLYAGTTLLSTDSDYVIYSNAKIYSDWITTP